MRRATVFVLSAVRSGSTLLEQCLGAHSGIVSLGEVHWLRAYVQRDRAQYDPRHELVCACGCEVGNCEFWSRVGEALGRPLDSLRLKLPLFESSNRGAISARIRNAARSWITGHASLLASPVAQHLFADARTVNDSLDLFDAACAVSGRSICVDSSKSPFRFRAVFNRQPARTLAIVLVRDYRAVVASEMSRGRTLESAARGWRIKMQQIEALTRGLPGPRVYPLKYESLCADPRREFSSLCAFLGLDFEESMICRPRAGSHGIGGSPSKFDVSRREIVLDRSYEGRLRPSDLKTIHDQVRDCASRWGYREEFSAGREKLRA